MSSVISDEGASSEESRPGFFSKKFWVNIATSWKFWQWSPREAAIAMISGWQTALCWNFGDWFLITIWKPVVIPVAKAVWGWIVTTAVTVWKVTTANLH